MTDSVLVDVPLTEEDEALMILAGFAFRAPDDVLTLTEKGSEWIQAWCRARTESAT